MQFVTFEFMEEVNLVQEKNLPRGISVANTSWPLIFMFCHYLQKFQVHHKVFC